MRPSNHFISPTTGISVYQWLWTRIIFWVFFLFVGTSLSAQISKDRLHNVSNHTRFIVDEGCRWTPEMAYARIADFKVPEREIYNFGMNDDALWIYLDLENEPNEEDQLCFLEPRITLLDVYVIQGIDLLPIYSTGQARAHDSREVDQPTYQLDLKEEYGNGNRKFLIRIEDSDKRNIPIYLGSERDVSSFLRNRGLLNGLYFGLLFAMIFYNTFVYIGIRDKSYLYYILFLLLMAFAQGHMSGMAQFYLYPDVSILKVRGSSIFSPLAGMMAILFISQILETRSSMPRYHKLLMFSILLYLTAVVLSITTESSYAYVFMQSGNLIGSLLVFICAIHAERKGNITAKFIVVGWSFLITAIVVYVFTELGILGYRYSFSPHVIQFGSACEVILFSFALAERINRYREEKMEMISENEQLLRESMQREKEDSRKLAEMELTALRGQMNPHFVFNALGAIQYYMQKNETALADVYLTKFAMLMRKYLESSRERLITYKEEIELLRLYTDLEMMRFGNKFSTQFIVDPELDLNNELLPSMLIQPFVENAIKHGLNDRLDEKGELKLMFSKVENGVLVVVADNGVGMKATEQKRTLGHQSRGMEMIKQRIANFKESAIGSVDLSFQSLDPDHPEFPGLIVELIIGTNLEEEDDE